MSYIKYRLISDVSLKTSTSLVPSQKRNSMIQPLATTVLRKSREQAGALPVSADPTPIPSPKMSSTTVASLRPDSKGVTLTVKVQLLFLDALLRLIAAMDNLALEILP